MASAQEGALKRVVFIPHWAPQSQFAGYYAAYEKGIYRRYGIDVEILRGGPERSSCEFLEQGKADFGTLFLSTGIEQRAQGVQLVNIGQIVQRSSLMLIAKKSDGIHVPEDLDGKKIGLWGPEFQMQPRAFFRKFGISATIVPQSTTLNLFLRGGVHAASAMWYNEYHTIINSGFDPDELTTFFLYEHGVNFPEDGIYCTAETFRENPNLSCRFVKASIEGWRYVFEHPDEALEIVMKYVDEANLPTDRCHQKWMLERMKDVILPAGLHIPLGTLRREDFDAVARELAASGMISTVPNFSDFFADCVARHEE